MQITSAVPSAQRGSKTDSPGQDLKGAPEDELPLGFGITEILNSIRETTDPEPESPQRGTSPEASRLLPDPDSAVTPAREGWLAWARHGVEDGLQGLAHGLWSLPARLRDRVEDIRDHAQHFFSDNKYPLLMTVPPVAVMAAYSFPHGTLLYAVMETAIVGKIYLALGDRVHRLPWPEEDKSAMAAISLCGQIFISGAVTLATHGSVLTGDGPGDPFGTDWDALGALVLLVEGASAVGNFIATSC